MPIVKHSIMIQDPRQIPEALHNAFHIARRAGPGPSWSTSPRTSARRHPVRAGHLGRPARLPTHQQGDAKQIRLAAKALANAASPSSTPAAEWSRRRHQRAHRARRVRPVPCHLHGDGAGRVPRAARTVAGHAGHARHPHRQLRDGRGGPDRLRRRPVRRPHHRQAVGVRPAGQVHPHRRGPGRDLEERPRPHPDRGRCQEDPPQAQPEYRALDTDSSRLDGWWHRIGAGRRSTGWATSPRGPEIKPSGW